MKFIDAITRSKKTGRPIKRRTEVYYGIIITRSDSYDSTQIVKYVNSENIYPLSLEDILADDWEIRDK